MKTVTLTQLKNNFSALIDLVKKGKTSLLVYERKTPVIRVVYAGQENSGGDEDEVVAARLERAGLLRRAPLREAALGDLRKLRVIPAKKGVDVVGAVLSNREEDR
jgi:antitoxin (DNA-binding transcriptional repressor) of toxin-antitoxin stability system